jgi:hypothetical protein
MTTKAETLLDKYCPSITALIQKTKIDWEKLDAQTKVQYEQKNVPHQTNIILLCYYAEDGDLFSTNFLSFMNDLVQETELLVSQKVKFRNIVAGKISNMDAWNYLNPIGEIAFLKKLLIAGYELVNIEDKAKYPELTPKDFLFKDRWGREWLFEILNIHVKDNDYSSLDFLKRRLHGAIQQKIEKETKGLQSSSSILYFQPIIWLFDFEKGEAYEAYFKEFNQTLGKEVHPIFRTLGYCTIAKAGDKFFFGEVSSFYNLRNA